MCSCGVPRKGRTTPKVRCIMLIIPSFIEPNLNAWVILVWSESETEFIYFNILNHNSMIHDIDISVIRRILLRL